MMLNKLFHDIVTELPIHEGRKAELHTQIDATVDKPEENENGEDAGTGSTDSPGGK
jgi:hypothetical protein